MASPTRYTSGVTDVTKSSSLGEYKRPSPLRIHEYFNDFDTYTATEWGVTEVGAATQGLQDADNGILRITNAAADNDSSFQRLQGEAFLMEAGKQAWFAARWKVSDAIQSDVIMGLQITDTTPLDVSDGIFFIKSDGAATLDLLVEKNNTATTTAAVATLVDDTYIETSFFYNGRDEVQIFINDVKVATSVTTNLPDDEVLTVSFGVQNGEAVAKIMDIDYVLAAKER